MNLSSRIPLYDRIGHGYAAHRRADPRIATALHAALGSAQTVVNVGAGTGGYEPHDRWVLAVEPSAVMVAQRPPDAPPALLARAEALPLADDGVDAAMAVLTVHHWDDVERGVRELQRVARERVVILTFDVEVTNRLWPLAEYLPETAAHDRRRFPAIADVTRWLHGARAQVVEVPRDCTDGFLVAYWARPEHLLDVERRAATSAFARLPPETQRRATERLRSDLASGAWDQRHRHLRASPSHDVGLRLIVA